MTLNGVMAVALRYFTEFNVGKPALQKTICGGIYTRLRVHVVVKKVHFRYLIS